MKVREFIDRLTGGESSGVEPSHVCQTCGEEYFVDRDSTIDTCRGCGGMKVRSV